MSFDKIKPVNLFSSLDLLSHFGIDFDTIVECTDEAIQGLNGDVCSFELSKKDVYEHEEVIFDFISNVLKDRVMAHVNSRRKAETGYLYTLIGDEDLVLHFGTYDEALKTGSNLFMNGEIYDCQVFSPKGILVFRADTGRQDSEDYPDDAIHYSVFANSQLIKEFRCFNRAHEYAVLLVKEVGIEDVIVVDDRGIIHLRTEHSDEDTYREERRPYEKRKNSHSYD